jgi:hypothetical protein
VHAVRGDIDLDLLFPPDAGELDRRGPAPESRPHHHEQFETSEWKAPAGIRCAEIEAKLTNEGLLRAKGFVETDEGIRLVQLVGRRIEITEPPIEPPEEILGRIVLIRRV